MIKQEKNCKTCDNFHECDNMGFYEECLPDMKYYKSSENTWKGIKEQNLNNFYKKE